MCINFEFIRCFTVHSELETCGRELYAYRIPFAFKSLHSNSECLRINSDFSPYIYCTFTVNPADGDYVFQLRANITIQKQTETFVGFTNTTLTYTIGMLSTRNDIDKTYYCLSVCASECLFVYLSICLSVSV